LLLAPLTRSTEVTFQADPQRGGRRLNRQALSGPMRYMPRLVEDESDETLAVGEASVRTV
jgi:hypothetical protein